MAKNLIIGMLIAICIVMAIGYQANEEPSGFEVYTDNTLTFGYSQVAGTPSFDTIEECRYAMNIIELRDGNRLNQVFFCK